MMTWPLVLETYAIARNQRLHPRLIRVADPDSARQCSDRRIPDRRHPPGRRILGGGSAHSPGVATFVLLMIALPLSGYRGFTGSRRGGRQGSRLRPIRSTASDPTAAYTLTVPNDIQDVVTQAAADAPPGDLPPLPIADVRPGRGPGRGRRDPAQRRPTRPRGPWPAVRRPARNGQDEHRTHRCQGGQLRERGRRRAGRHLRTLHRHPRWPRARRGRARRGQQQQGRRHARAPAARLHRAGGPQEEGLHHRRGPAHQGGLGRSPQDPRGAAARRHVHLLHDRSIGHPTSSRQPTPALHLPATPREADHGQAAPDRGGRWPIHHRRCPRPDQPARRRRNARRGVDARPGDLQRRRADRCGHGPRPPRSGRDGQRRSLRRGTRRRRLTGRYPRPRRARAGRPRPRGLCRPGGRAPARTINRVARRRRADGGHDPAAGPRRETPRRRRRQPRRCGRLSAPAGAGPPRWR